MITTNFIKKLLIDRHSIIDPKFIDDFYGFYNYNQKEYTPVIDLEILAK